MSGGLTDKVRGPARKWRWPRSAGVCQDEKPEVAGLAVPDMPAGSSGTGDGLRASYDVLVLSGKTARASTVRLSGRKPSSTSPGTWVRNATPNIKRCLAWRHGDDIKRSSLRSLIIQRPVCFAAFIHIDLGVGALHEPFLAGDKLHETEPK